MRIGVVSPYDLGAPGGVQQQVVGLVETARGAGLDAFAVGPGTPSDLGVDVGGAVTLPANGSRAPLAIGPGSWRRVRRAVADADVVHVHEPFMPLVSVAALTAGRPTVATFHADVPAWVATSYRVGRRAGRAILGDAVLTAVSPVAAGALPWSPVEVIPNGVEIGPEPGEARTPGRVCFLGRDEPRKGLDVLLAAWPAIRLARPEAELVVMGCERPVAPDGVRFLGRVGEEEKRRVLASSEIHVAPNLRGESFGIVLVEAMAAGCAVVASDLPAFRFVTGGTAEVVRVGDASELAAGVVRLLGDGALRRERSRDARARAAAFSWASVLDRYLACYERAAAVSS